MMNWTFFGSLSSRFLALRTLSNIGALHIIRMFCDEYILYIMEMRLAELKKISLTENISQLQVSCYFPFWWRGFHLFIRRSSFQKNYPEDYPLPETDLSGHPEPSPFFFSNVLSPAGRPAHLDAARGMPVAGNNGPSSSFPPHSVAHQLPPNPYAPPTMSTSNPPRPTMPDFLTSLRTPPGHFAGQRFQNPDFGH